LRHRVALASKVSTSRPSSCASGASAVDSIDAPRL
jgi:hypothetical protein